MLVALALAGLVSGCADRLTERSLIPPAGDDSGTCLDRCNLQRDECRSRQLAREEGCEAQRAILETDYQACREGGGSRCRAPDTCLGPDFSVCDQGYEMCFTDCGGRVETHWRSRPWETPQTETPQTETPQTEVPRTEAPDSAPATEASPPVGGEGDAPAGLDGPEHAEG
jgi:hypothetical protein